MTKASGFELTTINFGSPDPGALARFYGDQQMMIHLEIRVDHLEAAVAHAVRCGATLAEDQPQDEVRVCLDPAGHPFCLWFE